MIKRVCNLLMNIVLFFSLYGQNIEGNVHDRRLAPVSYASAYLLNASFYGLSDTSGRFTIRNVPPGNYTIVISAVGYATINETVQVTKAGSASFNFELEEASKQLDEVIVSAEKKEENLQNIPSAISALNAKNV